MPVVAVDLLDGRGHEVDDERALIWRQFGLAVFQVETVLSIVELISGRRFEEGLGPEERLTAFRTNKKQNEQRR